MSPTKRDGTRLKGSQSDTHDTVESADPAEAPASEGCGSPPSDDSRLTQGISATIARMALVRQHVLSVNGAYLHAPDTEA